jgi:hypothetical protein
MEFKSLSNYELLELYLNFNKALGDSHSLTLRVQEEIYMRMEGMGA